MVTPTLAKGEYDRAIQDYDQSIKLNPNYARAFNNRGVAYQKKGEYDRAIKDFDESIKLNPDYGNAFANRAEDLPEQGRVRASGCATMTRRSG